MIEKFLETYKLPNRTQTENLNTSITSKEIK